MANPPSSDVIQITNGLPSPSRTTRRWIVAGLSPSGPLNTLENFGSLSKLIDRFGTGQGTEEAAQMFAVTGGPIGFIRVNGSVAAANSAVTATGTSPTITVAGTALFDFNCLIEIMTTGILGAARFRYTLDNYTGSLPEERTYTESLTVPSGGTFVIPGTGITATFAAGTYNAGDTASFTASAAGYSNADMTAAMTAAAQSPIQWDDVLISGSAKCGNATAWAGIHAAAQAVLDTYANNEVYHRAISPAVADIAVSVSSAITALGSTVAARMLTPYGFARYVAGISGIPGRGYVDLPSSCGIACRAGVEQISTDLARVNSGPLPRIVKLFYDEQLNAGGTDDAGLASLTTMKNRSPEGFYITQGRMHAPSSSSINLWQLLGLIDEMSRICQRIGATWIGRNLRVKGDGTLLEADAATLEKEVYDEIKARLIDVKNADGTGGHLTDPNPGGEQTMVRVDRTVNFAATGRVDVDTRGQPPIAAKYITNRVSLQLIKKAS